MLQLPVHFHLPTMTRPYLHRVMPTQIWCLFVMKPKLPLSHPISACFFSIPRTVMSSSGLERTVDIRTIPYSLPRNRNSKNIVHTMDTVHICHCQFHRNNWKLESCFLIKPYYKCRGGGRYLRWGRGGGTGDGAYVRTQMLRGLGPCFPRKLGALRLLLRPYLYPNATSPTRVHGGSNTIVRHNTRQLSQGILVTIFNLVRIGPASVS